MKTLLISGFNGRMGQETSALAPAWGFSPKPFHAGEAGDIVLDFSHPDCLEALLPGALPLVIGTTGFSREQIRQIESRAQARPILLSANFSPGIAALTALARQAKRLLPDWELSLIERHHAEKKDAPSGTAASIAAELGLDASWILCVRAGTLRGTHEIGLYGRDEHITLTHTAESRTAFAHGALRAAAWLLDKPPGLYGMEDVLAEK